MHSNNVILLGIMRLLVVLLLSILPLACYNANASIGICDTVKLHKAVINGETKVVQELLEREDIDSTILNNDDMNALQLAAYNGRTDLVKDLLNRGANVLATTIGGKTALHFAAMGGHEDVIFLLLSNAKVKHSVDMIDRSGETALHKAAAFGHSKVITILLNHSKAIELRNNDGQTPLLHAIFNNRESALQTLVYAGANINVQDKFGNSALDNAIYTQNFQLVRFLLESLCEVNAHTGRNGYTALHNAIMIHREDIVNLLINYGANVNDQDLSGRTALHHAALVGNNEITELLLDRKATINTADHVGMTPLHLAAYYGNLRTVYLLVHHNANIQAIDSFGDTPETLAKKHNKGFIATFLREYGQTKYNLCPVDQSMNF